MRKFENILEISRLNGTGAGESVLNKIVAVPGSFHKNCEIQMLKLNDLINIFSMKTWHKYARNLSIGGNYIGHLYWAKFRNLFSLKSFAFKIAIFKGF